MATANGKNARNLDQGKVGDTVEEEVAILVGKGRCGPPRAAEAKAVELAPKGQNGVAANPVKIIASVVAIDYQTGAIALKGPLGNTRIFKVSDAVERLNDIKPGDQVFICMTEAIALTVVKP
jgi:hypothetical protein